MWGGGRVVGLPMILCLRVYGYVCVYLGVFVCLHVCLHVHVYVRMCVHVYVCLCVHVCIISFIVAKSNENCLKTLW